MKVIKSLNNSLVLCLNDKNEEIIIMGKGLGFRLKIGDLIPPEEIEKIFVLDSLTQSVTNEYIHLFENVSEELIFCVQKIIDYTNDQYDTPLNKNIMFTLLDHLNFAIQRINKGIIFQNKLGIEIQKYYPKEFEISCQAINLIHQELGIQLPEEEASNIALHIINAQSEQVNVAETIKSISMLKDILMLLNYTFPNIKVEKKSMMYLRFVTHLQFFVNRMIKNEVIPDKDDFLLHSVKERFPKAYDAAQAIKSYVELELNMVVNSDELVYLTLHISRIY